MGRSQIRHSRAKAFFQRIYEQSQAQASRRFVTELYCLDYAREHATVRNLARALRPPVFQTLINQSFSHPILHHLSTCIAIFWVLNRRQARTATNVRYAIPFTIALLSYSSAARWRTRNCICQISPPQRCPTRIPEKTDYLDAPTILYSLYTIKSTLWTC